MNNKVIVIGLSLAAISALLIYNSSQKDEKKSILTEKIEPAKTLQKTEDTKPLQVEKTIEKPLEKKLTPAEKEVAKVTIDTQTIVKKKKEEPKYSISILPENMSVQEKKQRFNELLVPAIEKVYSKLEKQYIDAKYILEHKTDDDALQSLMQSYQTNDEQELLRRLKPHPKSVALAQSAMQSGWATSRFTLIANNLFGVWSFDENEPRVQAHETRDGEFIYVKRYSSLQDSIEDYYKLLAISPLFQEFRKQKMQTDDPYILIQSLNKYYKKGDDFTKGLSELIQYNKFDQYDNK